jgi:PAS domain S-box-containing protein
MTEEASSERFRTIQDLMHEMVALWQRVTELEESDREHRKALEALRATEMRLGSIIGALPLRLFFKDVALTYMLCNEAYSLDWDMRADDMAGKTDRDLFAADTADKLADIEHEVIRTGKTEIAEEDRLVSGREVTFLAIRKPVIDAEGNTLGILGILQDITDEKRNRALQERRIHELEGALSERVAQVESLKNELEKASAEHRQKEEEFSRARSEMEGELQIRREEIHRLRNELQKEMYERGQAVEALKKSVAHSQELLASVQKLTDVR